MTPSFASLFHFQGPLLIRWSPPRKTRLISHLEVLNLTTSVKSLLSSHIFTGPRIRAWTALLSMVESGSRWGQGGEQRLCMSPCSGRVPAKQWQMLRLGTVIPQMLLGYVARPHPQPCPWQILLTFQPHAERPKACPVGPHFGGTG